MEVPDVQKKVRFVESGAENFFVQIKEDYFVNVEIYVCWAMVADVLHLMRWKMNHLFKVLNV